jgi:hypothetical protein
LYSEVLTGGVELFDLLADGDGRTLIFHEKRNFDVKMSDVRTQIVNAASIIENDLRLGRPRSALTPPRRSGRAESVGGRSCCTLRRR